MYVCMYEYTHTHTHILRETEEPAYRFSAKKAGKCSYHDLKCVRCVWS